MAGSLTLEIAEQTLALDGGGSPEVQPLGKAYRPFVVETSKCPDIFLHAFYDHLPPVDLSPASRLFDTGRLWSLYSWQGERAFVFKTAPPKVRPYRIALSGNGASHWRIITSASVIASVHQSSMPHPLSFPLAELIMVDYLALRRGALLHACGVIDGHRGILFCGRSGAGKSTMARLWAETGVILNDDRTILRRKDGAFSIYGTPWHGGFDEVSNAGAPLAAIFFLEHADQDWITPLSTASVRHRLLGCSWLPLWDQERMAEGLSLSAAVAREVPCYALGFRPAADVIERIRDAL